MINNEETKEEILDRLMITRRKAQDLQARLILRGKPELAKKIRASNRALSKEIDGLFVELINQWLGKAENVIQNIKTKNVQLQTSIRELKNDLENAEKLVKVVGLIDDVIGMARALT